MKIQRFRFDHNGAAIKDFSGPYVKFDDLDWVIERFFECMASECSGVDDGHTPALSDYVISGSLRPFMEHYIKNIGGI